MSALVSPPFESLGVFGLVIAGVAGLIVGSFLNVLIHRLPREESVVHPGSRCPSCGAAIAPWDNVPVLSWIALRGRCRACGARISPRYPLVELANGVLWAVFFLRSPSAADFASGALLSSACIALAFIDADVQLLPDVITLPGIVIGLVLSFFTRERTPLQALIGTAVGGGGLYLLGWTWSRLRRVDAMGLGDVKMLAMVGAFLGGWGVLLTAFFASVAGSLVGLALIVRKRGSLRTEIPFGVFLAMGAILAALAGTGLLESYRALWAR